MSVPRGRALARRRRTDAPQHDRDRVEDIRGHERLLPAAEGRIVPGRADVRILVRVLTTPLHAKQLCRALAQNIEQYERTFGEIAGAEDVGKRVGF